MNRTYHLNSIAAALVACVALYSTSSEALATEVGVPFYTARIWAILPGATTHPLADSGRSVLLGDRNELDAVDGTLKLEERIGTNDLGTGAFPSFVRAGIGKDGDVFHVFADSPNNYRIAETYIGSAAEVWIQKYFRKETEDARLSYTYSSATTYGFVNPEFGPGCPSSDRFCLSAGIFSTVSMRDAGDNLLWSAADNAMVNSDPSGSAFFRVDRLGFWESYPWVARNPSPNFGLGVLAAEAELDRPLTTSIDLSGVAVGADFTVTYHLYAYAYDRGSTLGLDRGAFAAAYDPLAGDTGVRFDWDGLTTRYHGAAPTAVAAPSTLALLMAGMVGLASQRRQRRADRQREEETVAGPRFPPESRHTSARA